MASPLTLRLDPELRRGLDQIAKRRKCTTSEVLRGAVARLVQEEKLRLTPYELMKDLIGTVEGGDPKLSEQTGRRFRASLSAREAKRDPR